MPGRWAWHVKREWKSMVKPEPSGLSLDSLQLSEPQVLRLLDEIDRRASSWDGREKRRRSRPPYATRWIIAELHHPAGSRAKYLVRPRNISPEGIAFLHGNVCPPHSAAVVTLRAIDQQTVQAAGMVVRCQPVQGKVHEIAVRFDEAIELGMFVIADSGAQEAEGRVLEVPSRVE